MSDVADRLESICERVEAATEGPWITSHHFPHIVDNGRTGDEYVQVAEARDNGKDDAAFIARSRSDVPYLLSLVEEVVDLAANWKRAYPPEVFPETPERPADGAKLAWIDPDTGEQLSEPFAIDRASAAMGRFMAAALRRALRDAAQEGADARE